MTSDSIAALTDSLVPFTSSGSLFLTAVPDFFVIPSPRITLRFSGLLNRITTSVGFFTTINTWLTESRDGLDFDGFSGAVSEKPEEANSVTAALK
ncbi:hypothetical protein BV898_03919 [Hypsibius exemplaris]|uniref:Uncharacterized protein n=1 Tax=Hypsibius exemplaris TaxID=2072580 RepID=A0A1W0X419_HYPEX|nr:hypothetical protein BV898_03919 [Hypsibius exemplaris]